VESVELEDAVASGVISPEIARDLRNFSATSRAAPLADEEHFGTVGGLADVMTAIGLILLLAGMSVALLPTGIVDAVIVLAACWGLAEFFTRRRKLVMTSFALFGVFALAAAFGFLAISMTIFPNRGIDMMAAEGLAGTPTSGIFIAAGTTLACAAYWLRFRLPIAYMVTAVAAVNLIVHVLRLAAPGAPAPIVSIVLLVAGVALFAIAMWWDMSDVRRETRRSDVAFWMHWAAGYQIAGASFRLLMGVDGDATGWDRLYKFNAMPAHGLVAVGVIALFALFCLVALIIDRRSLLLSSLAFVLPTTARLISDNPAAGAVITAIIAGGFLLLLATCWRMARQALLAGLPNSLRAQVPRTDLSFARPRPVA
jgi:hypothetical protein